MEHAAAPSLFDDIARAWSQDAALRPALRGLELAFEDGKPTVSGEVPDIAAKKRAYALADALAPGAMDRIRVAPRQVMADDEIRALLWDSFAAEPVFHDTRITAGARTAATDTHGAARIGFDVEDGVVRLSGRVPGLDCKRLAGVMAWWVPGSRDVVNGLAVAARDTFTSVAEAVRLVLEKDPCVEAATVRVGAVGRAITLAGSVANAEQRQLAELDAWYVFGVDKVTNGILVHR